jgi:hypothetical protein
LVVEFCLPLIQGGVRGKTPVPGRQLSTAERDALEIAGDGVTLIFDAKPTSVLLDMAGNNATLWFKEADCETALAPFDAALKGAFPSAQQLEDTPHPSGRATRTRAYRIELGAAKLATIEVGYPVPNATSADRMFIVRVKALMGQGGAGPRAAGAQPTEKKKGWF